jgi:hypothetical protein
LLHLKKEALMSAALAEPRDAVMTTTDSNSHTVRADASRANGRLSRGPTSPEGKARSRCNGCKDGLTGAGIVLPPAAAAEVERREAGFARDLRPRNEVERELVRQMALGAWRSHELGMRIIQHDARMNAARFANWEQDEQIAAAELGRRLADDPETYSLSSGFSRCQGRVAYAVPGALAPGTPWSMNSCDSPTTRQMPVTHR